MQGLRAEAVVETPCLHVPNTKSRVACRSAANAPRAACTNSAGTVLHRAWGTYSQTVCLLEGLNSSSAAGGPRQGAASAAFRSSFGLQNSVFRALPPCQNKSARAGLPEVQTTLDTDHRTTCYATMLRTFCMEMPVTLQGSVDVVTTLDMNRSIMTDVTMFRYSA